MHMKVEKVPIEKVQSTLFQVRAEIDSDRVKELADSIKSLGLLQPIVVCRLKDGYFGLVAGARRLSAMASLGETTIDAVVVKSHKKKNQLQMIVENLQRESVTAVEEAEAFHFLTDTMEMKQEDVAKFIGKSVSYVSQRLKLLSADKLIQSAVKEGTLDFSVAREIMTVDDETVRTQLFNFAVNSGATVQSIKDWIRAYTGEEPEAVTKDEVEDMITKATISKCDWCGSDMPSQMLTVFRICGKCAKCGIDAVSVAMEELAQA